MNRIDPSGYRPVEGIEGENSTTSAGEITEELLRKACQDDDSSLLAMALSGDIPWWILHMLEKGRQHRLVQQELAKIVGGQTDVAVLGGARSGRTDTYGFMDVATEFEVWEVKPNTDYGWLTGPGQLKKYIKASGKQAGSKTVIPDIPYTNPLTGESGFIKTTAGVGDYKGIVFYEFVKTPNVKVPVPVVVPEPDLSDVKDDIKDMFKGQNIDIDLEPVVVAEAGGISLTILIAIGLVLAF